MKFSYRIITLVLVGLGLSACSSYNPPKPAPLVSFQPTLQVQKQWSNSIGKGTNGKFLKLTPVIANGKIYANSNNGIAAAFDTESGDKIWKVNTGLTFTSGLTATDNLIFAGTDQAQIVAIQQAKGLPGWWRPVTSEVLATPYAASHKVLVKDESGTLTAFNTSGKQLWIYSHNDPSLILRGGSSPKIVGKYVIVGFSSGELVALNLYSGNVIWSKFIAEGHGGSDVERMVDIDADPQIANGVIYVATYRGKVAAVNLYNGRILWRHDLSSYSGLAVSGGNVYVSDTSGNVWDFDARTGAVVWRQTALSNRNISGPAVVGNGVVVGDVKGYLHFMSKADGHFVARVDVGGGAIMTAPIAVGNAVYVYTSGGKLAKYLVR